MAARVTDRQKKKIVADYLETQSVNTTAKRNSVSWGTVKRVLEESGDIAKKIEQKKAENTADILDYMESQREKVCELIDMGLEALPEKIQNARTATEITTALGTLIDKWTAKGQGGVLRDEREDDPVTKSIKEEMQNGLKR